MLLLIVALFLGAIILGVYALLPQGQAKREDKEVEEIEAREFPPPPASLDETLKEEAVFFKNEVENLKLENDRLKSELDLSRLKEAALKEEITKSRQRSNEAELEKLVRENTQLKESLKDKEGKLKEEIAKRAPPPSPIDAIPKEEYEELKKKFETAQEVLRRIHAS